MYVLLNPVESEVNSLTSNIFLFRLKVIHLKGDFIGDGITWPVVDGCDQFTLTVSVC